MNVQPRALRPRQGHPDLALVLATTGFVTGFADIVLVALKKQHLGTAFARIDFGGQWGGVGKLQCDVAFPLRLKRSHVDDVARSEAAAQLLGAPASPEELQKRSTVVGPAVTAEPAAAPAAPAESRWKRLFGKD